MKEVFHKEDRSPLPRVS